MKLFWSAASPYVRKVMACAVTRGIDGWIDKIATNPHASPPELLAHNPLSKVPCLVTEDGLALFDSPVICEYLDSVGDARPLFPAAGALRWRALKQQAIGDGILDAAIIRRMEGMRPAEAARTEFMERQKQAIQRACDALEADTPHTILDIGSITVACALGYLDFRFADDAWRSGRPNLTAWQESMAQQAGLLQTVPVG